MAAEKMEMKLTALISTNKKNADAVINTLTRDIKKMEGQMETWMKEWKEEKEAWKQERTAWQEEKQQMQAEIIVLKEEVTSLRAQPSREEGEICEEDRKALKEELTKAITETIEVKTKDITEKMEAKQEGWVEIVKKNIRNEVDIVHTTIEEEKMRRARKLNTRVTGIKETENSPEEDGKALCTKLGYEEEDQPPFTKAWRAGKDNSKEKALILQFPTEIAKITFMKKKSILRGLEEEPAIYLDDDLTWLQREHRRGCMPRIHKARKEGKKATYRDGRVIIDGKIIE